MLPSWATDVVTLVEPTWVDERGKQVAVYGDEGVAVSGCSVQPGASSEDLALRDNAEVAATAYLPPGVAVSRHARVLWDGGVYEVVGEPQKWRSPLGSLDHIVVALTRREG